MKKLIGIMYYFLILTGCADKAEEVAMIEEVSEPASEGTMQTMLLEYMWCDFGPETTEEAMAALTADFNEIVSSSEYKVSSAWGYIPSFETDLYDAIWLNVWSDEKTRDMGWKEWGENRADAFQAKYDSVLACNEEKIFHFSGTIGREAGEWTAEPPFQAQFDFCNFNEGMDSSNLNASLQKFNAWISAAEEAAGSKSSYNYIVHDPLFDTSTAGGTVGEYDYLMGGYWQNMEDKESGMASWEATNNGLQDEFDSIGTCQQLSMDGYPIVMPAI